ncbi:hypothetical protein CROQUDRAFT_289451 [Cronartium quercuum f. sp. fusiforme G11]|uniref:Uncharacterized protein n=1 Tax=Cronartium quercuum f. sp. fusiforme G11 TaxID=708437 RepID=A0A9P6NQB1_9BASI|nr:hypothetical protein CROQUDRAFT_289451 [Cronartium quercuum f. sp. fusiforme G11]
MYLTLRILLLFSIACIVAAGEQDHQQGDNGNSHSDTGKDSSSVSKSFTIGTEGGAGEHHDTSDSGKNQSGSGGQEHKPEHGSNQDEHGHHSKGNSDPKSSLCLDPSVIQKNASFDGIVNKTNPDHFAPSLTSTNNFINFCVGSKITDGVQVDEGSCNPTPMGMIPSKQKMPSVKIKTPTPTQKIEVNTTFEIQLLVKNMETGFFSSPSNTYFLAPQQLNGDGYIKGHVHVVLQALREEDDAPDTSVFAFFKGISNPAKNGILTTPVTGGLPDGRYRLSTITSSVNHQVAALPVAGRGGVEDAIYFNVGTGQGSGNKNGNGGDEASGSGKGKDENSKSGNQTGQVYLSNPLTWAKESLQT